MEEVTTIFSNNPYKIKIPEDKRQPILQDLIQRYQARYGEDWVQGLQKNLKPSPVKEIAETYGVSPLVVRSLKHTLWLLGTIASPQAI
jgi:hypothetical protein